MTDIGMHVLELDTPALWVDLDIMDKNITCLAGYFNKDGVSWRPHTKGIKIPAIAHKLLDAGAIGITCAKLSEAEVMAAGGIKDILIANQVVGETKVNRLVNLRHHADVMVAVDDIGNAVDISKAAEQVGLKVRTLIELDSGMQRCGLQPGPNVVEFARKLTDLPGIQLAGLMAWEGHVCKIEDAAEKKAQTEKAVGSLVHTAKLCREAGIAIPIVSCGGTGDFRISANIPGVTEIQAGGGIFGDLTYQKWGADTQFSLFILATICSHALPGRAVVDAGRKAMNVEYSMPIVRDCPGAKFVRMAAEHGTLQLDDETDQLVKVGDKINIIPGYEDLTVFLYDKLYGVRNGKVEVIWEVQGRGKLT
jgi:D-serine deaminase-like pyridoxal phosphate-dependent protein